MHALGEEPTLPVGARPSSDSRVKFSAPYRSGSQRLRRGCAACQRYWPRRLGLRRAAQNPRPSDCGGATSGAREDFFGQESDKEV